LNDLGFKLDSAITYGHL